MRGAPVRDNALAARIQLDGAWMRHAVVTRALLWAQVQTAQDGRRRFIYYRSVSQAHADTPDPAMSVTFRHEEQAIVRDFQLADPIHPDYGTHCCTVTRNAQGGADYEFHPALKVPA